MHPPTLSSTRTTVLDGMISGTAPDAGTGRAPARRPIFGLELVTTEFSMDLNYLMKKCQKSFPPRLKSAQVRAILECLCVPEAGRSLACACTLGAPASSRRNRYTHRGRPGHAILLMADRISKLAFTQGEQRRAGDQATPATLTPHLTPHRVRIRSTVAPENYAFPNTSGFSKLFGLPPASPVRMLPSAALKDFSTPSLPLPAIWGVR